MSNSTVITVTGIRPDFVRMSSVFSELDNDESIRHILVHTGQHYDALLSDVFFDEFKIRSPDYNLHIGGPGKTHYEQLSNVSIGLLRLIKDEHLFPDMVLFLGDSNSVLASVSVRKEGIPVGHIEAGMRSYDRRMLEETNRVVCDHCSDMLFVYHEDYRENCLREGLDPSSIFVVGNTIVEVCNGVLRGLSSPSFKEKKHILLDIHRPENFLYADRLKSILSFARLCGHMYSLPVLMLSFRRALLAIKSFGLSLAGLDVVDLMSYKRFLRVQLDSLFLLSDSGTAQEEPALLGVPVIVPRDYTERPQSIRHQCSRMLSVGCHDSELAAVEWIDSSPVPDPSWLGDGHTASRIKDLVRGIYHGL